MKTHEADITIIIPCYNTKPEFLNEAINSIKNYSGKFSYDIVVVDDGSSGKATLACLDEWQQRNIKVLFQTNKGPAAARNNGVKNAQSEYILFLDSDDRLNPVFIDEGIDALTTDKKAGVVYSNALAFGDASRENFIAKPFDITELLIQNFIPMCVVMRKQAWQTVNGLDEGLIQYEDWELWISIYKAEWQFVYINKPMFQYRISSTSLIAQEREKNYKKAVEYIYKKHWDLVYEVFHRLYANSIIYNNDMRRPLRSFIKYSKKKYLS